MVSAARTREGARLSEDELCARAARIRLVLTDCDGVLTDGGVYYSAAGEELRRFSVRDGMGFALLRAEGLACGIVSGEPSGSIAARATKLRLEEVHLGVSDKAARLREILARLDLSPSACAYMGDDVNDLGAIDALRDGLVACPSDAVARVRDEAHITVPARGGDHAFRAFADVLLSLRQRGAHVPHA